MPLNKSIHIHVSKALKYNHSCHLVVILYISSLEQNLVAVTLRPCSLGLGGGRNTPTHQKGQRPFWTRLVFPARRGSLDVCEPALPTSTLGFMVFSDSKKLRMFLRYVVHEQ